LSHNSVRASFSTNRITYCKTKIIEEGETLKKISETSFFSEHEIMFGNLMPETNYKLSITCKDRFGHTDQLNRSIKTLSPPDVTPPPNPAQFSARFKNGAIKLQWQNPEVDDFQEVKLVRSTDFYPITPYGFGKKIIFSGIKESFSDKDVIPGMTYYYTIFSFDKSGNRSSGAISSVQTPEKFEPSKIEDKQEQPIEKEPESEKKQRTSEEKEVKEKQPTETETDKDKPKQEKEVLPDKEEKENKKPTTTKKVTTTKRNNKKEDITESDVFFKTLEVELKELTEINDANITSGEYREFLSYTEDIPNQVKNIIVTVKKDGYQESFLLSLNKNNQVFSGTVFLPKSGKNILEFQFLNQGNKVLKTLKKEVKIKSLKEPKTKESSSIKYKKVLFWLLLLLLLIFVVDRTIKKIREVSKNKEGKS